MNNKIKGLAVILWNFFIALSIVVFLVNILYMIEENTTDTLTVILSTCGCCFLIITVVWNRFHDIMEKEDTSE